MHNLGTVFGFEVVRSLKKRSFWITAMSFPVIIAVVFAIIFFSNQATHTAAEGTKNQHFSIAVTDNSGVIAPTLLKAIKASVITDKAQGIADVKSGKIDAYFYYPADIATQKVQVYAKDVGLFDNGRYQAVAAMLLQQSVAHKVDPQTTAILQNNVNYDAVTYKDGAVYNGLSQVIAPGAFLVLFYILIVMFGNQMLTSTTEEKENRVIEMILTTIKARTLIIGKILSLVVLALVQVCAILIPIIIIYLLFREQLALPNIDLTNIPLDPLRIAIGAALFACSFMLFTGLLVAIGSAVPTAKEASGFFGVVMIFLFGPLYAVTLFISAPESGLVKILSFFPFTAPIPLMLRNAVGNLSVPEALLGVIILAISATAVLAIAIRLFRYGALEYSKRLSLGTIFRKKGSVTVRR
jgi:ABC-2 type transport system permease protein